jgi:hypothetical protein
VRIDPLTGYFHGRAWGENVGWVSFSAGAPLASTARTSWCLATAAPPGESVSVSVAKSGTLATLSWSALSDASWYEVVSGSLSTLQASGGDFAAATGRCVVGKLVATSHALVEPDPPAGNGLWYLVRGANCHGHGTYDSGAASQVGLRDAEIAASGSDCP